MLCFCDVQKTWLISCLYPILINHFHALRLDFQHPASVTWLEYSLPSHWSGCKSWGVPPPRNSPPPVTSGSWCVHNPTVSLLGENPDALTCVFPTITQFPHGTEFQMSRAVTCLTAHQRVLLCLLCLSPTLPSVFPGVQSQINYLLLNLCLNIYF